MYRTACGRTIVVPETTAQHLAAHPEVGSLLQEAIGHVNLPSDGSNLAIEVELGRIVGRSGCVPTEPIRLDQLSTFALRANRLKPSRIVVGIEGREIGHVVIIASPAYGDTYRLVTAYVGDLAPKEPWDPSIRDKDELEASIEFWCSHALVHHPEVMGEPFESTWEKILGS